MNYIIHNRYQQDREEIRIWLIHSILKASGVWGSGLDTLLTSLREIINEHGNERFPTQQIRSAMARRGKSLVFDQEEIEDLSDMDHKDKRLLSLLSLLFPFAADFGNQFHIDHVFPKSFFTKNRLNKAGVDPGAIDKYKEWCNRLANTQLLLGPKNLEKAQTLPLDWLKREFPDEIRRNEHVRKYCLGEVPEKISEFGEFYQTRRGLLKNRITELLA